MVELTQTARLKIVAETEGVDAATRSMEEFQAAQEKVGGSTISVARALERHRKSLDDSYNSFKQFENTQRDLIKAREQELTSAAEYNKLTALNKKRYEEATVANDNFNKSVKAGTGEQRLARHELINLSRQIQDVGVGLASGQGFGTILVQQGTQMADIFATSTGTLRGFFTQATAGAAGFLRSAVGVASTVAAFGTGIVYAAASYASGQKEIEKSLTGIGRASGVTRDQINQIAETSSSAFGLSISEARTAATAFAATGKIYQQNVGSATKIVDDYARAGGDAAEVTKMLATALQDPAAGAVELNKQFGFLDATTLNYIRTMQQQGQLQAAQAALMEAAGPSIRKQAEQIDFFTKAWNLARRSASEYFELVGQLALRGVEGATGVKAGGYSQQEEYDRARKNLAEKQASPFQGALAQPGIRAAEAEVRRLEKAFIDLGLAREKTRLAQLSLEADAAARSIMPLTAEIEKVRLAMNKLQEQRMTTGGPVTDAEKVGSVKLLQLEQENAALVRQAEATSRIALMYPGMTIEGAKQLYNLQQQTVAAQAQGTATQLQAQQQMNINLMVAQGVPLHQATAIAVAQTGLAQAQINAQAQQQLVAAQGQLSVAQARGGAEKIVAQEQATIKELIAQQVDPAKALEIAATRRAAAEENVKAAIENQIKSLQDQERLIRARANGNEASVKAEIAYEKAIKDGSGEALAAQLRDQTLRVERIREAEAAEREVADAVQSTQSMQVAAHNQQITAIAETRAANNALYAELEDKIGFTITLIQSMQDAMTGAFTTQQGFTGWAEIFTKPGGGYSQFDPKGYVSEVPTPVSVPKETPEEAAERMWGSGGFKEIKQLSQFSVMARVGEKYEPTVQGRIFQQQQMIEAGLQMGDTLQDAFRKTLAAPFEESQQLMQQIIALASPTEQTGMLQQAIERAREQPATLANEQLIKQLTDQLKGLTSSTDSLNATLQSALSPYYSQDPRTTKLGFRAGVTGNPAWMTGATNESALDAILGPGATAPTVTTTTVTSTSSSGSSGSTLTSGAIQLPDEIRYPYGKTGFAGGGSFIVPGGYSSNDNKMVQFPAASGEQVVVNRTPQDGGDDKPSVVNIDNRIVIVGGVDDRAIGKFKVSRYQQGQRMRASMAG